MKTEIVSMFDFAITGKSEKADTLIDLLSAHPALSAILLGGSLSFNPSLEHADTDLFCLLNDRSAIEAVLSEICIQLSGFDALIYQGNFPWTKRLYTIYFRDEPDFSIDLCLIDRSEAEDFFWEPNGILLVDKWGELATIRRIQLITSKFPAHPFNKENPFTLAIVTLKKIRKNICRGHLWNAFELLNIMRRYIMQLIRATLPGSGAYLGRVDRDIEDVLPVAINQRLKATLPIYDQVDIAHKTIILADLLLSYEHLLMENEERFYRQWIGRQLRHERVKLLTFTKHA